VADDRPAGRPSFRNLSILRALQIRPGETQLPLAPKASAATLAAIDRVGGPAPIHRFEPGCGMAEQAVAPQRFGALAAALRLAPGCDRW
jgi:hypothetical protein